MSIELIAVLIVIVTIVAINSKKKKPDKKPAKKIQDTVVVEKHLTTEKSDHGIYTGKILVVVEKDGEKTEEGVGIAETWLKNLRC